MDPITGRSTRYRAIAYTHGCEAPNEDVAINAIAITNDVAGRFTPPAGFGQLIIVLAIVVFFAWTAWNENHLGWAHILALGASVLALALIWIWPGNREPTQPPP
jgi:hypothetical protein